jgi:hypothetical protein
MSKPKICRMCGRAIRSERSLKIKMGPGCAKKFGGLLEREYLEAQGQMTLFPSGPPSLKKYDNSVT